VPEDRVQRALARAGIASRRASEDLIREGRVTINGRPAVLGDRVDPGTDVVTLDGIPVPLDPALRTFALHKPSGVVSTLGDERGRPDLRTFLPDVPGLVPVGRLDRDTEGLLLLTNDGELANRLMHPRYRVEKEYLVEVAGVPSSRHAALLERGIDLDDGPARAVSARVEGRTADRGALRVVMAEGRKREVRRMLEAIGLPVTRLVRTRIGPIRLERLAPGAVRELTVTEVRALHGIGASTPLGPRPTVPERAPRSSRRR
jgi:23S rRNA pseudouridine2605 synthase